MSSTHSKLYLAVTGILTHHPFCLWQAFQRSKSRLEFFSLNLMYLPKFCCLKAQKIKALFVATLRQIRNNVAFCLFLKSRYYITLLIPLQKKAIGCAFHWTILYENKLPKDFHCYSAISKSHAQKFYRIKSQEKPKQN